MTHSRTRRIGRAILILIGSLIVLIALIIGTLSFTLPITAKHFLQKKEIDFNVDNLVFHAWRGRIEIKKLSISDITTTQALTAERILLDIDLTKLFERTINLESIELDTIFVPLSSKADGSQLSIANIPLTRLMGASTDQSTPPDATQETAQQSPWQLSWQAITLNDVRAVHRNIESDTDLRLTVSQLHVDNYSPPNGDYQFNVTFNFAADDIAIDSQSEVVLQNNIVSGETDLNLQALTINGIRNITRHFQVALPEQMQNAEGIFTTSTHITFALAETPNLTLSKLALNGSDVLFKIDDTQHAITDFNLSIDELFIDATKQAIIVHRLGIFDSSATYSATTHQPPTEIKLSDINIDIDQFDNTQRDLATAVALRAKIGEHGAISATGKLLVNQPESSTKFLIQGEQINLTEFGGLAATYIDRTINTGAMDFQTQFNIDNKLIDSKATLHMHQFAFGAAKKSAVETSNGEPQNKFDAQLGMPLNTALNLLRDKDDSIRLSIPITGSTDNPEIHLSNIVNTVVLNAIKTAALTQLGPLMAISALEKLNDLKNAATLKPLNFSQNSLLLDPEGEQLLNQLSQFLAKKDRLYVNVCGVANADEQIAIVQLPKVDKKSKRNLTPSSLIDLANKRANLAKSYLVQQGIDGKRLIVCAGEVESDSTKKPRVEFSL